MLNDRSTARVLLLVASIVAAPRLASSRGAVGSRLVSLNVQYLVR